MSKMHLMSKWIPSSGIIFSICISSEARSLEGDRMMILYFLSGKWYLLLPHLNALCMHLCCFQFCNHVILTLLVLLIDVENNL